MKAITLSAALDTGTAKLDDIVYAGPTVEIGGADINNYGKYDYGSPTLQEAFALSSNTAFGQLGVEVGAKNLVKYCNAFGFGQTLGQDFSCKASVMPDPSEMTDWETAWSACGQPVGEDKALVGLGHRTTPKGDCAHPMIANASVSRRPAQRRSVAGFSPAAPSAVSFGGSAGVKLPFSISHCG